MNVQERYKSSHEFFEKFIPQYEKEQMPDNEFDDTKPKNSRDGKEVGRLIAEELKESLPKNL